MSPRAADPPGQVELARELVEGLPLLRLVRLPCEIDPTRLDAAREELLDRTTPAREAAFRWGYLLGVEDAARPGLPRAHEVERALREGLIAPLEAVSGRRYALSFLKTTVGAAPPASEGVHFDGFHLDTHPELVEEDGGVELARLLVNLAPTPRRFRFARTTRFQLAARGLPIHRGDYQVVELPDDVEMTTIEIPGREPGVLHALRFWASVVPHVGEERSDGHFLASYEAIAPYPLPAA